VGVKNKKRKVIPRHVDLSRQGRSYYSSAMDMARSSWQSGDPEFALDMLLHITEKFPKYEPAYRLMLGIFIEEEYVPEDIVWCLGQLKKIGRLKPADKIEYGIREFELSHFKKALPLLEKACQLSPPVLRQWGYEPQIIEIYARNCRTHLGRPSVEPVSAGTVSGAKPRQNRGTRDKMAGHSKVNGNIKKQMTKLSKLCEYVPHTSKTARLLELLEISKEKVLVFSRFTATLEEIAQRLSEAGVNFSMFQGNMSAADKDRAVGNFQNGTNVMLCSEIGGEGRNLQFCSTMVNFDLPWNPMKIEQRIGRIHRIGQTRPVHVYNLCAANTAEHHILDMLDRRINMFELIIGEMDLVLGQTKTEAEFEDRILDIYGQSKNDQDVTTAFESLGNELLAARQQYDKINPLANEKRRKLSALKDKYKLRLTLRPLALLLARLPVRRCDILVKRRKGQRQLSFVYNLLSRRFDPLACEACGEDTYTLGFCDGALHLLCAACLSEFTDRKKCPRCRGERPPSKIEGVIRRLGIEDSGRSGA